MSTAASDYLQAFTNRLADDDPRKAAFTEVLTELQERRAAETERRELRTIAARQGYSPISIHNDLLIPTGTQLTRHATVQFQAGPSPRDYLELTMPTTRDEGWVQVTTGDFGSNATVQLRSGILMLRAEAK